MPDITTGLIAHYTFDEGTGSTAADSSASGYDGSISGASWTTGQIGGALDFDGTNDYIDVPDTGPSITAMSIAFWFRVDAFDIAWQTIAAKGEDAKWRVARNSTNNTLDWSGLSNQSVSTDTSVNDGLWHHFVGTHSGTDVIAYLDGVEDNTRTGVTSPSAQSLGPFLIGENPEATGRFWEGAIDDFRIYNRALTADDVAELYAYSGSGDPELFITAAFTEPNETLSAAAAVTVTGSATFTEPNETLSSETDVLNTIDAAFTEPNETLSSTVAGATLIVADFTEPNETLSSLVDNPVVLVGIQVPEPNETLTSAVNVIVGLDLSATEPDETLSSLTGVLVTAALDVTEPNESLNSYTHHGDTPPSSGAAGHRGINIRSIGIGL